MTKQVGRQPWVDNGDGTASVKVADPGVEESNLVRHAQRELELAGLFDEDADYGGMLAEGVMRLVRVFAEEGHSGASAGITVAILERLLRFQPLTPLTDDPAEWNEVGEDTWQSSRRPDAFSEDGGKTYYLLDEEPRVIHTSVPRAG